MVYAKRKSWKDAKVVFLKCCKSGASGEFTPSTTAWLYLGLSCLRLNELTHAEDALSQANILDHLNPKIWGLNSILCLSGSIPRKPQAEKSFKEALRLGLKDADILDELGDLYSRDDDTLPLAQ